MTQPAREQMEAFYANPTGEYEHALRLAGHVLDDPNQDPDSDLSMLARQFLRRVENVQTLLSLTPPAQGGELWEALDEWTADELRQSVRTVVDAPNCGHNTYARMIGISSAKLSEFLSGKRGAEPSIVEPMGYRWALVRSEKYPRPEDTLSAIPDASPGSGSASALSVPDAGVRDVVEEAIDFLGSVASQVALGDGLDGALFTLRGKMRRAISTAPASSEAIAPTAERLRSALERIVRLDQQREWTATPDNPETRWVIHDGICAKIARAALSDAGEGSGVADAGAVAGSGESVKPADIGLLSTLTDQEIEKHGPMYSSMVRAGLLRDILAELFDHRSYRNATLASPASDGLRSARSDTDLLNALRDECWDLRCMSVATGGDDYDVMWKVVGHWMADPVERIVAEGWSDDPRVAIRAALDQPQSAEGGE